MIEGRFTHLACVRTWPKRVHEYDCTASHPWTGEIESELQLLIYHFVDGQKPFKGRGRKGIPRHCIHCGRLFTLEAHEERLVDTMLMDSPPLSELEVAAFTPPPVEYAPGLKRLQNMRKGYFYEVLPQGETEPARVECIADSQRDNGSILAVGVTEDGVLRKFMEPELASWYAVKNITGWERCGREFTFAGGEPARLIRIPEKKELDRRTRSLQGRARYQQKKEALGEPIAKPDLWEPVKPEQVQFRARNPKRDPWASTEPEKEQEEKLVSKPKKNTGLAESQKYPVFQNTREACQPQKRRGRPKRY